MRRIVIAILTALLPLEPASAAKLKGVDLYRSDRLTLASVEKRFGDQIKEYARLHERRDAKSEKKAADLKSHIEVGLRAMARLAYADLYYAEYVTSAQRSSYVTLDVVDARDAKARMPFRRAPRGQVSDPRHLLADWNAYAAAGQRLFSQGRLDIDERPECSAFYCLWGRGTPELAAYEGRFVDNVAAARGGLLQAAASDASPRQRAAALYLLSYLKNGDEVARVMLDALADPSPEPRTAALRVLADLATYHKEVFIEVSRLVPVLDYPSVPDRAGALAVLVGLADNKTYRPFVLSHATVPAARLLRLSQPGNQDLAFTLLSMLSQTPFDRNDYDSWDQWAQAQSAPADAQSGGH